MSHPFTWVPAAWQRHASRDPVPPPAAEFPQGVLVSTLCGQELTSASGELAWLWGTCPECDDAAREIVGVPSRAETAAEGRGRS
ncbi:MULTISPECIES: zinc finger protein [Actinopolyspora]|uniref:Zinc-finger n=1 Tax=Actinopolyspora saharensis TaxID=995062 RepID=A0A1H1ELD5_9ACTN|nr:MULTISPECIES: zinc finger protein [Actinopolyspora]NHD18118.1 hypothetical protein [Actinopolyspora sp. BKK2]NHE77205.1 hypothetical protein [Actinopolyspora sp. BKK1]SDQ89348.1 zinc-finger [Actinopolyspora saharensis]